VAGDYDQVGFSIFRNLVNGFRCGSRFHNIFDRCLSEFTVEVRLQLVYGRAAGLEFQVGSPAFDDIENNQPASNAACDASRLARRFQRPTREIDGQ
jgi:hypothetical protein